MYTNQRTVSVLQNETNLYHQRIEREVGQAISGTEFIEGPKKVGKVRDSYVLNDKVILITTDRVRCPPASFIMHL